MHIKCTYSPISMNNGNCWYMWMIIASALVVQVIELLSILLFNIDLQLRESCSTSTNLINYNLITRQPHPMALAMAQISTSRRSYHRQINIQTLRFVSMSVNCLTSSRTASLFRSGYLRPIQHIFSVLIPLLNYPVPYYGCQTFTHGFDILPLTNTWIYSELWIRISGCRSGNVDQWMSISECRSVNVDQWMSISECRSVNVDQWMSISECRSVNVDQWMSLVNALYVDQLMPISRCECRSVNVIHWMSVGWCWRHYWTQMWMLITKCWSVNVDHWMSISGRVLCNYFFVLISSDCAVYTRYIQYFSLTGFPTDDPHRI